MKFDIRLAASKDAEYLADIHAKSWLFAYGDIVSTEIINAQNTRWPMIWETMLENNTNAHYAVLLDDEIIGFLSIAVSRDIDLSKEYYEIIGLYLDPKHIGYGFGMQTMDWIKRIIQSRGYNNISLWVLEENHRARNFYEKAGFRADGMTKLSGLADTKEVRYLCNL